jgi:hypothetical protein
MEERNMKRNKKREKHGREKYGVFNILSNFFCLALWPSNLAFTHPLTCLLPHHQTPNQTNHPPHHCPHPVLRLSPYFK